MNNYIGTRNESALHRSLKFRYVGTGGRTEEVVGDFIADGISESGELIEVQTGSFGPLVKKIKEFSTLGKVRIVHPIAVTKIIEVYELDGTFVHRRKSPKKGSIWSVFDALLYAPELPLTKNVVIEIVLADITEKRLKKGRSGRRRKETSIVNKELSAWHESILFKKKSDFQRFIPFKKGEEFTVSSLAKHAGINTLIARKALYVLTKMKVVKRIGKKRNAFIYCYP
ncbi:MAG: hypothetical protein LBC80_08080 [Treponema sp.]|jgi:ribosomal protein S25|nr:hypothetical protein [Treponema sp.]